MFRMHRYINPMCGREITNRYIIRTIICTCVLLLIRAVSFGGRVRTVGIVVLLGFSAFLCLVPLSVISCAFVIILCLSIR